MVIATATPLIMAAIKAVSQLFTLNHCGNNGRNHIMCFMKAMERLGDRVVTFLNVMQITCECDTQSLAEVNVAS